MNIASALVLNEIVEMSLITSCSSYTRILAKCRENPIVLLTEQQALYHLRKGQLGVQVVESLVQAFVETRAWFSASSNRDILALLARALYLYPTTRPLLHETTKSNRRFSV